ncbi:MAG: aldo/keto reductase [Paracoccus sp. (in: a-proteobacteria)]|nr:aldo/keto reductase [Paracoccus sp. (in: a-proteobacteria)]
MERVDIATDLQLSRIAYGMWRLGDDPDTSPAHVRRKIEAALAQGITTIDQADIYGGYRAQALMGAALREAPALRDGIEIVSKAGIIELSGPFADRRVKHYDLSPAHLTASVEASLRDLATDRIDLLLIHRPDPTMDADETGPALDRLVSSGKVRALGVSNFRPWDIELLQSRMAEPLRVNQIELSLAAHEPFANGDLAYMQQHRILPMAWSPLAGGALMAGAEPDLLAAMRDMAAAKGCDMAALAVAWLLAHPVGIVPVMGTNNLERIGRLSDALRINLDREDWFTLYAAALGRPVA